MQHHVTFPEKKSVRQPSIVNLIEHRKATQRQIYDYLRTYVDVTLTEHEFVQYDAVCRMCAHAVKLRKITLSTATQALQMEIDVIKREREAMEEKEKECQRRLARAVRFQMERSQMTPVPA